MSAPTPLPNGERGSLILGFLFGMGLDFLWYCCAALPLGGPQGFIHKAFGDGAGTVLTLLTFEAYGIAQWIVVCPALLYFQRRQQSKTVRGLLLQAVLVMLVDFYEWAAQGGLPALGR